MGDGDGGRQQSSHRSDYSDYIHCYRGQHKQVAKSGNHVESGSDHRGRMDQGGNWCRTFHRIGKPYIERNLRRFPSCSKKKQQGDHRHQNASVFKLGCSLGIDRVEFKTADTEENQEHCGKHSKISYTIKQKRFFAGFCSGMFLKVITDQEIGTEAHPFPADKHQQEAVTENQNQHEEDKKVEIGKKTIVARLPFHISDGINMDQKTHPSDDQ